MRKNVIVVLCDALRYDHICKDFTPNLIKISKQGTVFENFYSLGTTTLTSIPYILCGKERFDFTESIQYKLSQRGYHTVLISTNQFMMADFDKGWIESYYYPEFVMKKLPRVIHKVLHFIEKWIYRYIPRKLQVVLKALKCDAFGGSYLPADEMLNIARRKIEELPKPYFVWVHLMDSHLPYMPTSRTRNLREKILLLKLHTKVMSSFWKGGDFLTLKEKRFLRLLYAECVMELDRAIGAFSDTLDGGTLLIVLSDHGEELGEEGHYTHSETRKVEMLTHIPLILTPAPQLRVQKRATTASFKRIVGSFLGVDL